MNMMQQLITAIQDRLAQELSTENVQNKWLLDLLKVNSCWIRAGHVTLLKGQLQLWSGVRSSRDAIFTTIASHEHYFLRDIFVWLPEIMFMGSNEVVCPSCDSSSHVEAYGFLKARR